MKWSEEDEPGLKPGAKYPCEVIEAEERTSKKGNAYINLKIRVFEDENSFTMYDVLMPKMPMKLKAFCRACGLMEHYKAKNVAAEDCLGKTPLVELSKERDDNGYLKPFSYHENSAYEEPINDKKPEGSDAEQAVDEKDIPF